MLSSESLTAICPECAEQITLQTNPPLHFLLLCPHCETILMVTAVSPLRLDWAFEEPLSPDDQYPYLLHGSNFWQFNHRV